MLGFAILLAFQMVGIAIQKVFPFGVPSNVIGLALFTISLFLGWVKLEWVEKTADFMLKHMTLFFLPLIVGSLVLHRFVGGTELLMSLVTLAVSTVAVLIVTGWVAKLFVREGEDEDAGSVKLG